MFEYNKAYMKKTASKLVARLLRRLQAQTLSDATPQIGKIYPFTKITITFNPLM